LAARDGKIIRWLVYDNYNRPTRLLIENFAFDVAKLEED